MQTSSLSPRKILHANSIKNTNGLNTTDEHKSTTRKAFERVCRVSAAACTSTGDAKNPSHRIHCNGAQRRTLQNQTIPKCSRDWVLCCCLFRRSQIPQAECSLSFRTTPHSYMRMLPLCTSSVCLIISAYLERSKSLLHVPLSARAANTESQGTKFHRTKRQDTQLKTTRIEMEFAFDFHLQSAKDGFL